MIQLDLPINCSGGFIHFITLESFEASLGENCVKECIRSHFRQSHLLPSSLLSCNSPKFQDDLHDQIHMHLNSVHQRNQAVLPGREELNLRPKCLCRHGHTHTTRATTPQVTHAPEQGSCRAAVERLASRWLAGSGHVLGKFC